MLKPFIPLFLVHMVKAQQNLTYLDVFWAPAPTLTLISSNDVATTYEYSCPRTTSTSPSPTSTTEYVPFRGSPSERSAQEASYISSLLAYFSTAIPAETPTRYSGGCGAPITIFQGPETYGYRLTITESSFLTLNGECTWKGVFTEVPITCDAEMKGSMYSRQFERGTPTVFQQSEFRNGRTVGFAVATVVQGAGRETGTGTGDAGVAKETGAESTGSQGHAGHVVFPTGVMAMAGGAFAVGAAAWVL